MSPGPLRTGKSAATHGLLHEDELTPGAVRVGNYKAVSTFAGTMGPRRVASRWTPPRVEGVSKYVAVVPQVFNLGRTRRAVDLFMNNLRTDVDPCDDRRGDEELMRPTCSTRPRSCRARGTRVGHLTDYERYQHAGRLKREGINFRCSRVTRVPVRAPAS